MFNILACVNILRAPHRAAKFNLHANFIRRKKGCFEPH